MDSGPRPDAGALETWRPEGCNHIALVLQGGGALGAYQAGVYHALHEAGLEPDWIAGVSIGSVNGAIIAGNPPDRRLERLRAFWELATSRPVWGIPVDGDDLHKAHNIWSSALTASLGQPGLFMPRVPNPWFAPRGSRGATSFYDSAPLRETLLQLVDFDRLNDGGIRFACGAVNVVSGNYTYFDTASATILPEHVMASAALPPALPMIQVGTDWHWDGGIVSNTPLQHLIDNVGHCSTLVFQVDLFSARGPLPRDMADVLGRHKDIQYSSRTRLTTDRYLQLCKLERQVRSLLDRLPDSALSADEQSMKQALRNLPRLSILQLIYDQRVYEDAAKDYDFSRSSMRAHWESGYRDTEHTLHHRDWLAMPSENDGVVVHDVHRIDD